MYAAPAIVPTAGTVQRTAFLTFIPLLIVGIAVLSIGGTIVIALIPLYLEQKTITTNADVLTTQSITMSVEIGPNDANARRKRTTTDLSQYVGGEFTSAGIEMIKSKLFTSVSSKKLQDLIITSIFIAYENQNQKRKRFVLSKRATDQKIVLIMVFKLIYISGCLIACQNEQGPNLRNSLYNIPVTQFVFTNIPISIGGILETIPGITFMQVLYITPIMSGLNSATPVVPILTLNLTQSTTITTTTAQTTITTMTPTTTQTTITTMTPTTTIPSTPGLG